MSLSRYAIVLGALCVFVMSTSAIAAPAASRKGLTKVAIKHLFKQSDASASAALAIAGEDAVVLEDYDSYWLVSAPKERVEQITARAAAAGVGAAAHDEYDLLGLPGGTLDTRIGVLPPQGAELVAQYPKGVFGLYVLQFLGPPKPGWLIDIVKLGGIVIEPIPVNGYLAALTPEVAPRVAALRQVQFLDVYQPFQKAAMVDRGASEEQDVIVQLADAPGLDTTIKELAARLGTLTETKNWGGHYVSGRLHSQDVASLLAMPLVIGVHRITALLPSDERQAMSLTTHLTTSGGNTIPTLPGTYASWLTDPAACNVCGNLSDEGFIIGIADTGLDDGSTETHHVDLQPANRVRYGHVFLGTRDLQGTCPQGDICETTTVCSTCDGFFHGTFLAGVAAGNAATLKLDTTTPGLRFFLGTGVAPTAGIFSTKTNNSLGQMSPLHNIFEWAADATSHSVYIQNHSHNEYGANPSATGWYTQLSHDFDVAVRNTIGAGSPITLSVSAGNQHQDAFQIMLLPPATAKNVIAVGGAESVRDSSEWRNPYCLDTSFVPAASSYDNIDANSKHGTLVQSGGHSWDTYAKPDLFAPASQIVSTRTTLLTPQMPTPLACLGYGTNSPNYDPDYFISSGTSFAAPVAAGAALIASRVYAASLGGTPNPAAASPALLKAMLIGSARSMRAGFDKATSPTSPIAARPNATQGFGRISLVDIVSQTPLRQYVDQAQARTFTASGQRWSATYPVSDPNQPVKVVLVWTDASAPAGVGNVATLLQNDLDLSVNIGDSTNCRSYAGNNLTASTQMTTEGEESVLYSCGAGHPDTKNNTEMVVFFPAAAGVTQFTVVVDARIIGASAIPDLNCQGQLNSDCLDQDFALFIYNAGSPINLAAPTDVTASATSTTSINVTWSPASGADRYEVSRRTNGGYSVLTSTATTSFVDTSAAPNTAYLYRVQALDPAGSPGAYSAPDLATTIVFTDDPIVSGATTIKAVHFDQLRQAVNAVRAAANLGAASFTDPTLPGITIKAVHILELRTNLDQARTALGLSALTYTDPTITAGTTIIKALHVTELRNGVE